MLVDTDPVEQVHGLLFWIVVGLDLFFEKRQQEWLEIEVAIEKSKLLENDFAALHPFRAFVFIELLGQIAFDRGSRGEVTLDVAFDGQAGLVGRELNELVDQGEELLCLVRRDTGFAVVLGCGIGWNLSSGRRRSRCRGCGRR